MKMQKPCYLCTFVCSIIWALDLEHEGTVEGRGPVAVLHTRDGSRNLGAGTDAQAWLEVRVLLRLPPPVRTGRGWGFNRALGFADAEGVRLQRSHCSTGIFGRFAACRLSLPLLLEFVIPGDPQNHPLETRISIKLS